MSHDPEPDIVDIILLECRARGLDAQTAELIESRIRAEYGGQRMRIPKRNKHLTLEQRAEIRREGLSNLPTDEITAKFKIGRATLYRIMKGD